MTGSSTLSPTSLQLTTKEDKRKIIGEAVSDWDAAPSAVFGQRIFSIEMIIRTLSPIGGQRSNYHEMVRVVGFEPTPPWSQTMCATPGCLNLLYALLAKNIEEFGKFFKLFIEIWVRKPRPLVRGGSRPSHTPPKPCVGKKRITLLMNFFLSAYHVVELQERLKMYKEEQYEGFLS